MQDALLQTLLAQGHQALHKHIQQVWPLDAEAAFGAIPTPLRLHADPRFTGRGVAIAMVDVGFYPHPDLTQPTNRIRAWVDATAPAGPQALFFSPEEQPAWPGWDARHDRQWHGTMMATAAAGNGHLSHGLYRGLACDADIVLVQVRNDQQGISDEAIVRALQWLAACTSLPFITRARIEFVLHEHEAQDVRVSGSWHGWDGPGMALAKTEPGVWRGDIPRLPPGEYTYKFLVDGWRWLDDPAKPDKRWDGRAGFNSVLFVPLQRN